MEFFLEVMFFETCQVTRAGWAADVGPGAMVHGGRVRGIRYAGVAQLVEQCFRKAEVAGSIPASG